MRIPSIRIFWANGEVTVHTMQSAERMAENKFLARQIARTEWL